jgi:uncharacterized protein (DUF427 family)
MGVRLRDMFISQLANLRYEPIDKRIRAMVDGQTSIDSTRALLVWEPKRVVASYAVPVEDVDGEVLPPSEAAEADPAADTVDEPRLGDRPVLDPSVPFAVHTADGHPLVIRLAIGDRSALAFRPADPALDGYVIVDFRGFDEWYEEDERNLAHPRDPFHRIEILHSSRHVRVELDGTVLAESDRPYLLFEPPLPARYYLPAEDVRIDLLEPTGRETYCAYKGRASYWSFGDEDDLAWSYQQPLREASEITDRVAFFNERVDIIVDGQRLDRPVTPWSRGPR